MKIVTLFLKYGYGQKEMGDSLEQSSFLPALLATGNEICPFWLEEHGFPEDHERLQKEIISFVKQDQPDLVFMLLMGQEIELSTIIELGKMTKTLNWFGDDQWRFDSFSSKIAPYLDYVVTVDKYSVDRYRELGCQKVILSQWSTPFYQENITDNYQYEISFIGGQNNVRQWYIEQLEKRGFKVACFGNGWDNGTVSQEKMLEIFNTSKINLNLSNSIPRDFGFLLYLVKILCKSVLKTNFLQPFKYLKNIKEDLKNIKKFWTGEKNIEQIKARNFEISAAGGFQLSHYALTLEDYYSIGQEIAVYTGIQELVLQIKYYLKNDAERKKIAYNGWRRSEVYSYRYRLQEILDKVENL